MLEAVQVLTNKLWDNTVHTCAHIQDLCVISFHMSLKFTVGFNADSQTQLSPTCLLSPSLSLFAFSLSQPLSLSLINSQSHSLPWLSLFSLSLSLSLSHSLSLSLSISIYISISISISLYLSISQSHSLALQITDSPCYTETVHHISDSLKCL